MTRSVIRKYFKDYAENINGFNLFHNQVINMPRDAFSNIGLKKIQILSSYLLLLKNDTLIDFNYKEILSHISNKIKNNIFPVNNFRDLNIERKYFLYYNEGDDYRMFRHLMGLCEFFGLIISESKRIKKINFTMCSDYCDIKTENLNSFVKNISLNININSNDFIKNLDEIEINSDADYRPMYAILKYMQDIDRSVTEYEISILLGRIDNTIPQNERSIIDRALNVGRELPVTTQEDQQEYFFKCMGWKDNEGRLFNYKSSQQPYFKFQTLILFLINFDLIKKNSLTKKLELTEYAKELLRENYIPIALADLEKILNDDSLKDEDLKKIILKYNVETIKKLLKEEEVCKKINKNSIDNPIIKSGKRQRNRFIAELAKIKANYECQAGTKTFKQSDGKNYVEAHHIIEFSLGGPDIIDNLLVLGPTPHSLLHHGSNEEKESLYNKLKFKKIINDNTFDDMVKYYNSLKKEHIKLLSERHLITLEKSEELLKYIE